MMYLVVYDSTTGKLVTGSAGSYEKPLGMIKYLEVDVPEGRYVTGVNVSKSPHKAELSEPSRDLVAEKLTELEARQVMMEELSYTSMEAVVSIYEAVLPFLPR